VKLRLSRYSPHKPSPKQMAFLAFDGLEAFYGGAAGGGKSDALLMAALQYVDVPNYSAILFRRSYTDLALPGALMDRAHEWLAEPIKRGEVKWNRETHTFEFPTGATIAFGYISAPRDMYRYQSAEFQYVGFDEIAEWPDDEAYKFLFSRLRKTKALGNIPLRVRCASNPIGPGAVWVRKRFLEDPNENRIYVPANFEDNPYLERESYLRSLKELPESTQRRLIEGSWEEIDDAAFPEFKKELHVIPEIAPPYDWRRWEAMDFGVSNPTCWLAAALSPEGHTIIYGEYYSPGLIQDHASKILTLRAQRWGEPLLSLCDPAIKARTGFGVSGKGDTVHSEFQRNGLYLVPANNDRIEGRVRISQLLRPDISSPLPDWHPRKGELGSPKLFITSNCKNLIEQLKTAPLDPVDGEIIDPFWETRYGHAVAACRYLTTARIYPRDTLYTRDGNYRTLKGREWRSFPVWEPV
jgi:hypothetical protein